LDDANLQNKRDALYRNINSIIEDEANEEESKED